LNPYYDDDLVDRGLYDTVSDTSMAKIRIDHEIRVFPNYGLPARIDVANLPACKSVVHVIDRVLIPDRRPLVGLGLSVETIQQYEQK